MKIGDYSKRKDAIKFHTKRFAGLGGEIIKNWEKSILLEFLEEFRPEKVIDLGAGTGRISEILISKFKPQKIVLVDSSESMLEFAKERIKNTAVTNVEFDIQDVLRLRTIEKFDLVVSFHLVKHLKEIKVFLSNVNSILAKDGKFILDFANKNSLVQLGKGEVRLYTLQEMVDKSKSNGLIVKGIKGVNFFGETAYIVLPYFLTKPLFLLDKLICYLIPGYATKIFLKLEKGR